MEKQYRNRNSVWRSIPYDAVSGREVPLNSVNYYHVTDPVKPTDDGWILGSVTGKTIYQLPSVVSYSCYAMHKKSVVVGTKWDQLLVINFPPALFASQGAHTVGGARRAEIVYDEDDWVSEWAAEAHHSGGGVCTICEQVRAIR
jgi:hypothetical protein